MSHWLLRSVGESAENHQRRNMASVKDAIWEHVDNSLEGYGDLIQMCLDRLTMTQLSEVLESLSGGDEV